MDRGSVCLTGNAAGRWPGEGPADRHTETGANHGDIRADPRRQDRRNRNTGCNAADGPNGHHTTASSSRSYHRTDEGSENDQKNHQRNARDERDAFAAHGASVAPIRIAGSGMRGPRWISDRHGARFSRETGNWRPATESCRHSRHQPHQGVLRRRGARQLAGDPAFAKDDDAGTQVEDFG
jgi:hypothetical protein